MDFAKSKGLKKVLDDLKKGEKEVKVSGLWGSAQALLLSSLSKKLFRPILRYRNFNKQKTGQAKRAVILVIASDEERRIAIEEDLGIFGTEVPILAFPSQEMNIRLSCLSQIPSFTNFLLVTEKETLQEKIISPDDFLKFSRRIKINEDLKREKFIKGLLSSGYEGTPMIERRGEFSIRGGIIDIWSPQDENPLRIELMGEKIASLRRFDPLTQRSIERIKEAQIIPFTLKGNATLSDYLPKNTLIATEETHHPSPITHHQVIHFHFQ